MNKRLLLILFILFNSVYYIKSQQTQTLDYYLYQGVQNSPLLKEIREQYNISDFDSLKLRAQFRPQINANANITVPPTYKGYGYDKAITNGGNYLALAGISQSIFYNKSLSSQFNELILNKQAYGNNSSVTAAELKKNITEKYLKAFADSRELTLNNTIISLLNQESSILQQLVQQGIYRQAEYLSFNLEVQTQLIQIKQMQLQYRKDMGDLNLLCGIADTNFCLLSEPDIKPLPRKNISSSRFYQHFRVDSLQIENKKLMVNSRYYPKLSLFADAGLLSSDLSQSYKNIGFSFGLNFSFPICDGRQKNIDYMKLGISENIRSNYRDFFKIQFNRQVYELNKQLDATREIIKSLNSQLQNSESLINTYKHLLNTGNVSVTDLILAIRNNLNININLNQQKTNEMMIINEINYWNQ